MFTLESGWERHQSVALRFSTAVCTSNNSLNYLPLALFSFLFTYMFSLSLRTFNERRRKFWIFDASVWKRKETNERTNQHRFVYTVAIAGEPAYIFFPSLTIKSVVVERASLCLCSFIRPVRFSLLSIHSFTRTNPGKERHVYFYSNKDKGTKLKINIHSMTTTHKGKEKKDETDSRYFLSLWVTKKRANLLQSICIMHSFELNTHAIILLYAFYPVRLALIRCLFLYCYHSFLFFSFPDKHTVHSFIASN
jgi:hypothetical protein